MIGAEERVGVRILEVIHREIAEARGGFGDATTGAATTTRLARSIARRALVSRAHVVWVTAHARRIEACPTSATETRTPIAAANDERGGKNDTTGQGKGAHHVRKGDDP